MARTSLVVRRLTQILLTARVTVNATPPTNSTPASPNMAISILL
ncbi:MAG TPA: hypothetical protein VMM78_07130 [Thermomicrobiales bacterium]|nr:hypothetical protein [Thermomicrobiales bacterium]